MGRHADKVLDDIPYQNHTTQYHARPNHMYVAQIRVDRHTVQCDVTYDRPAEPYHYHRETLAATAAALI